MKVINDFHCTILVRTNRPLSYVSESLKTQPTRTLLKGQRISRFVKPLETNIWELERIYNNYTSIDSELEKFFLEFSDLYDSILICDFKEEICMRLFIHSDYAQIVNVISSKTMRKLSTLDINIEVSVFSWGKA